MQLSEIITLVRSLCDEVNATAVLTDTELTNFINARYRETITEIVELNENFFLTTDTESTIASQAAYNLPQDSNGTCEVIRLKRVEIAYDSSNWYLAYPIDLVDKIDTESTQTAYSQYQPYYYLLGTTINFLPIPTATGTNNIKFWYAKRQPDLSVSSDRPAIPEEYHHILAYGAAADVKRKEGDAADSILMQDLENKFEKGVAKMLKTIQPRVIQSPKSVKDVEDMPARLNEDWVAPGSLT